MSELNDLDGYTSPSSQPDAAELREHTTEISDDSLVENRITGLLSQDNPYMQQATTRGLQQANQRGLLSSSMAVGAVEDSRIAAALPIAQQDASLYGQRDLQDSAYTQQGNLNIQNYQNTLNTNEHQGLINAGLQDQQGNINSRLQAEQAELNANNALAEIAAQGDVNSRLQAEQAIQNRQAQLQESIAAIESDSSLTAEQRNSRINNEISLYNATATIIAQSMGLSTTSWLYSGMTNPSPGTGTTDTPSGGGTSTPAVPTGAGMGVNANGAWNTVGEDDLYPAPDGYKWISVAGGGGYRLVER